MKLSSILPLIRRFAPVDDCSSSPNLFTQWHSKTPVGGLPSRSSRSSRITVQQPYFVFKESACSSPSALNNRQRHTNSASSAKLSRPVICSLAGRRHISVADAFSSSASQRIPVTAIRADDEFAKAFYTPTAPRPRLGILRRLERRCSGRHFFHSRCANRNGTRTRSTSNRKPSRQAEKEECVTHEYLLRNPV